MGGIGSGRKAEKRVTVDECNRLHIKTFLESIRRIESGNWLKATQTLYWPFTRQWSCTVKITLVGGPETIQSWITHTTKELNNKPSVTYHYQTGLTFTTTPWNARRYWWICPNCGRRCGILYIPPESTLFACRTCYNLTYRTCQESHKSDLLLARLLTYMGQDILLPA